MREEAITSLSLPLHLSNGHVIPNRIIKAAMSERMAERDSGPGEKMFKLYERWSRSGAGVLITGNVAFDPLGRAEIENVILEDDRHLDKLREWAEIAQTHGSQLWMQINHAGRQAPKQITTKPFAPSSVGLKGMGGLFGTPQELTEERIQWLIGGFAKTAELAKRAGFSGVQIHAAHGYLINQFLSPLSNQRTDRWGGSLENRKRFLVETIRAVRQKVGEKFPLAVKLNSSDFQRGGFTEEESMDVVKTLEVEGIELLEISGGNYESPTMTGVTDRNGNLRKSTQEREAYFLEFAKQIREITSIPLMLTGGLRSASTMEKVVDEGHVDCVGLARPMTIEPELPAKLIAGTSSGAVHTTPKVGIKLFDSMLSVSWYHRQMERMASGLEPSKKLGVWSTLFLAVVGNLPFHPKKWFWAKKKQPLPQNV